MVADLLPRVERSHLWFSENVELLFCAQIALSCHRSEGGPPVEHLPFNVEGGAPSLELPDVGAQLGLALLVGVGKGALVARISTFQVRMARVIRSNYQEKLISHNCDVRTKEEEESGK